MFIVHFLLTLTELPFLLPSQRPSHFQVFLNLITLQSLVRIALMGMSMMLLEHGQLTSAYMKKGDSLPLSSY